ncbi:hypothetical protein ACOKFD_00975 [Flagellimonas sp. S174]|uniref:hypothetical protein n=1 Tax=Flagellimonas sp. S174 TaxID=3410790 RepID=UPI003BF5410D
MRKSKLYFLFLLFSLVTLSFTSCDGCTEEKTTGEKIEEGVEETGEAIEEGAEEVEDEVEDAVDDN